MPGMPLIRGRGWRSEPMGRSIPVAGNRQRQRAIWREPHRQLPPDLRLVDTDATAASAIACEDIGLGLLEID
jgi:hypothetical protein